MLKCSKKLNHLQGTHGWCSVCFYHLTGTFTYFSCIPIRWWIRWWSQVCHCIRQYVNVNSSPSVTLYSIPLTNDVWHFKSLGVNLWGSMQKLIMLLWHWSIPSWQFKCNLLYFFLCWPFTSRSALTDICHFPSAKPGRSQDYPGGRVTASEGTNKACWQFRWITDYFNVISVHCLKRD